MKTTSASLKKAIARLLVSAFCAMAIAPAAMAQRMVNVATDATDPHNLTDSEPSIAVNPRNHNEIAIVTFSEPWEATKGAPVWRSTDGGATWTKIHIIPRPPRNGPGPGDQFLAFDSAGQLYIAELEVPPTGGQFLANYIYRQNGPFETAFLAGINYGEDQPLVAVDRTAGSCANRLYSPWLKFPKDNPPSERVRSMVSHSANGGAAMTSVGAGDHSSFPNRTTRVAVAPNGRAYIVYKTRHGSDASTPQNFENAQFRVMRSDDCGHSWVGLGTAGSTVHGPGTVQTWFTDNFGNPSKGATNRARSSDAWIAADPGDGDIYVAYVRRDDSGRGQIYVARSRDQGATWVSTRVTDGSRHSAFPEIAVADNGAVGVLYIDYDDSGPRTIFNHGFARSVDDGATWTRKVLQSMDPNALIHPKEQIDTFIWGDYEGLTAAGNTFYGVFTGQSLPGKRSSVQLDPIFFTEPANAEVSQNPEPRRPAPR